MAEWIASGKNRALQVVDERPETWTAAKRAQFLDRLAETCNVAKSVRDVGMSTAGLYQRRRRDPEFAAQWADALRLGYERLEERLLQHALAVTETIERQTLAERTLDVNGAEAARVPLSREEQQLISFLLNRYSATMAGTQPAKHRQRRRATAAETDAALTAKLDALERRLKAQT